MSYQNSYDGNATAAKQNEEAFQNPDMICRINAKGKVLDFRNSLVPANPENYAMLHGQGGAKYARLSSIQATICDYSDKTKDANGGSSVTVSANMPRHVFSLFKEVCVKNLGTSSVMIRDPNPNNKEWQGIATYFHHVAVALQKAQTICTTMAVAVYSLISGVTNALRNKFKGADDKSFLESLGKAFADASNRFTSPQDDQTLQLAAPAVPTGVYTDYHYEQVRVNVRKLHKDGAKVFVSTVTVDRMVMDGKGNKQMLPWSIRISNFWALPKIHDNGTQSYIRSSVDANETMTAVIKCDDDEMYRCCYNIEHFISVWENSVCIPLVRGGLTAKEESYQKWKAQQQNG